MGDGAVDPFEGDVNRCQVTQRARVLFAGPTFDLGTAAILWGVLPALAKPLFANRKKTGKTVGICVSIVVTAVLSSLVLTTAGLVIMLGYNFYAIMPGRLVQFAIMIPIYCVLTCLLYFSPLTAMVVGNTSPAVLKNKTV